MQSGSHVVVCIVVETMRFGQNPQIYTTAYVCTYDILIAYFFLFYEKPNNAADQQ